MKFKIRFADKIVGFFIIVSIVSLVFVVLMLGQSQRWFAKDITFYTVLPSAGGLSNNMAVQYKGFTIGNVKSFELNENDDVDVIFYIYEEYYDRVKQGSMLEMNVSPIGLGSQLQFHSGRGVSILPEGSLIPVVGSAQARELVRQGFAEEPSQDDSISVLLARVNVILDEVTRTLAFANEAIGPGNDDTEIGKMVRSVQKIIEEAEMIPGMLDDTVADLMRMVEGIIDDVVNENVNTIMASVNDIMSDISGIIAEIRSPDGLLFSILDTEKEVYGSLVDSLGHVTSILNSLDRTIEFIPGQMPQLAGTILELRSNLNVVEDVLVSLTNNPLLKSGIPQRPEIQGGGTSPRESIRF